jgi:hypothetical protein
MSHPSPSLGKIDWEDSGTALQNQGPSKGKPEFGAGVADPPPTIFAKGEHRGQTSPLNKGR